MRAKLSTKNLFYKISDYVMGYNQPTCNSQVDPGAVRRTLVSLPQVHDGALVPALVDRADLGQLDGRLVVEKTDASNVSGVDVRRKPVQLDEYWNLNIAQ